MITIFLSYSRGDDEPFVKRLYEDLSQLGFDVWFDRVSMPSRQLTFFQEIRDAIAARERLLLVIGPTARTSEYVTQEWKNALEMGKCVNPIVRLNDHRDDGGTVDGYDLMPEELKLIHAEDFRDDSRYAEHFANLIRQLSDPAPPLGKLVAVPTLPLHYLGQRDRLLNLRDALLIDLQKPVVITGAAARVGVQGMGGIGKSVLAAALARDFEVRRAFPDGIFWIGVGQQPNLVELQRFITRELGDESLFNDLHAGKQKLKELLEGRTALLILDDVWQSTDANAFDVLGPRCKLLLTTRDAGLVSTMAGTGYQVQLPTEAEALALLANAARVPVESLPPLASEIIAECGRLPLALALCGGMASKGHLWERILRALGESRLDLIADRNEIEEHHRSIWRAMEVSVQVLSPDEQRRFAELAVFATDAAIPEAAVLTLWSHTGGLDELAAADLLVAFNERSLVQLDRSADPAGSIRVRVSLHDLLHDFAMRLATQLFEKLAALHNQLLDVYRKRCPNGWPTGPNDGYFFQRLRDHLIEAGQSDELVSLLLDLQWLEAKAGNGLVFDLPVDFSEAFRFARGDHPQRRFLPLIEEALRRDLHFIARHREDYPEALFQCLWNSCWWYDCPDVAAYYERGWRRLQSQTAEPNGSLPWQRRGNKLYALLNSWRAKKEHAMPGFHWLRSLRPPPMHLGTALKAVFHHEETQLTDFCFSLDGSRVAAWSDDAIWIWEIRTNREIGSIRKHPGKIKTVCFSPDGDRILSGSSDCRVRVWDVCSGQERVCLHGHEDEVTSVCYSPDGKMVASGSLDRTVRLWKPADGDGGICLRGHHGSIGRVVFSRDGKQLISASRDWTIRIWDAALGAELSSLCFSEPHDPTWEEIHDFDCSLDGRHVAICRLSGQIGIVDTITGTKGSYEYERNVMLRSFALSPDGSRFAIGDADWTVRMYNVADGKKLRGFRSQTGEIFGVKFSPDGRYFASRAGRKGDHDNSIRVWDMESPDEPLYLPTPWYSVGGIVFSKDGKRLAADHGFDGVRIYDAVSGLQMWSFDDHLSDEAINRLCPDYRDLKEDAVDKFMSSMSEPEVISIAGPLWYADLNSQEIAIKPASSGEAIAWFPIRLTCLTAHPSGTKWAGAIDNYLCIFAIEGVANKQDDEQSTWTTRVCRTRPRGTD